MADDINMMMGTYKVVAINVTTTQPDYLVQSGAFRSFMIYKDAPQFKAASYKVSTLLIQTEDPDIKAASASFRGFLIYKDSPNFKMAAYKTKSITATTNDPDIYGVMAGLRYAIVFSPPPGMMASARQVFIIDQKATGPAIYIPTFLSQVLQDNKDEWPSPELTFSTTTVIQHAEQVLQADYTPLPHGDTIVPSVAMKAVTDAPELVGVPNSNTDVHSYAHAVVQANPTYFVQSDTHVSHVVQLSLQSDLHEHVPVSADYVMQHFEQVVQQSTDLEIWTSPAYFYSMAQTELYATPMGRLPRSTTSAYQSAFKTLQAADEEPMPQSITESRQAAFKTLFEYHDVVVTQGTDYVAQNAFLTMQYSDFDIGQVGPNEVTQNAMKVLQHADNDNVVGMVEVRGHAMLELQAEQYDSPENIGNTHGMTVLMKALQGTTYQNPDLYASQTPVRSVNLQALESSDGMEMWVSPAIVPSAYLQWLQRADYPNPDEIVPPAKAALTPSLAIQAAQDIGERGMPQSITRLNELAILASQYLFYTPASDLATKGIFISQLVGTVAKNVTYPDPDQPISPIQADVVAMTYASQDDSFPDPTKEAKPLETNLVVEIYASGAEYPDPTVSQVWAEVSQSAMAYAGPVAYPDASIPVSPIELTLAAVAYSINADGYGDPADMVSPAEASLVTMQVSSPSVYADPALPASELNVTGSWLMVSSPDVALQGIPDNEQKHRPIITISIVYRRTD